MRLKVSELDLGFQNKTFEISSNDLAERGTIFKEKVIKATLNLLKEKNYFCLYGTLEATPRYTCVRCLKKNPVQLNLPIKILIIEDTISNNFKNDSDITYFNRLDNYINLKKVFADLIALAEPIQPLCEEECLGLCPRCGTVKRKFCTCTETISTTNWDKLKNLQIQ